MTIFEFLPHVPDLFRPPIQQFISELQEITPSWCSKILISWDNSDDGDTSIYTVCHYEYRWAKMTFCAAFFDQSPTTQREMIAHDLIHVFGLVENHYTCQTIKKLLPDEKDRVLKDVILEELRVRHESVTQDLSDLILKLIDKTKGS